MAKKHKNLENIKIQWDGDLSKPTDGSAQSAPNRLDIPWGGYIPCWYPDKHANCVIEDMYFEDFDFASQPPSEGVTIERSDGILDVVDISGWVNVGRGDIASEVSSIIGSGCSSPNDTTGKGCTPAPKTTYTWGDVSFIIEIADGLGTGSRRAREARLQELDKEKKKRLIRLICRVKGEETAYDETKEVYPGDIQLKLDDVDMVISKVVGTMKVSTEWEEVDWDYGYDK